MRRSSLDRARAAPWRWSRNRAALCIHELDDTPEPDIDGGGGVWAELPKLATRERGRGPTAVEPEVHPPGCSTPITVSSAIATPITASPAMPPAAAAGPSSSSFVVQRRRAAANS